MFLRRKYLQRDIAKDMHPKQRDQSIGTRARLEPGSQVPRCDRGKDEEAQELGGCLRGREIVHDDLLDNDGSRERVACAPARTRRPNTMRRSRPSFRISLW